MDCEPRFVAVVVCQEFAAYWTADLDECGSLKSIVLNYGIGYPGRPWHGVDIVNGILTDRDPELGGKGEERDVLQGISVDYFTTCDMLTLRSRAI